MTIIRKVLTTCSLFLAAGFAQETNTEIVDEWNNDAYIANRDKASQDSIAAAASDAPYSSQNDSDNTLADAADTANFAIRVDSVQQQNSTEPPAPKAWVKPRNKITYEEYQAKVLQAAKKRSRTLHHGLSFVGANYHDKNYWHMDHDATWGTGLGMYYFYRRYFGQFLGFQGRLGALYRYARWTFDESQQDGKLSSGEKYTLVHNIDRKYHNIAADLPLTGKFGYHVKGTNTYLFTSMTFGLTKPIYELVDTENRLYLKTADNGLKADLELINSANQNPFPIYESHQTHKVFYMDDWETSGWIGLGIENRLFSFEFQMYAIGGATQNANHRYYHIGHDSNPTWRLFLDFSIR